MPLRFEVLDDPGVVLTTAHGDVTPSDLDAHARALAASPDRPALELVDFTGIGTVVLDDVGMDSIRRMAEALRRADADRPGSRLAMVADDEAVFGILRLYAAHREDESIDIAVFRVRDDAIRWLGLPEGGLPGLGASGPA